MSTMAMASASRKNPIPTQPAPQAQSPNCTGAPSRVTLNAERIEEFKDSRLASKVRAATVNRDLAVLRRMLKIAERTRLINASPFREIEMLEEREERRQPHILTFDEEKKLLAVAPDHVRILAIF